MANGQAEDSADGRVGRGAQQLEPGDGRDGGAAAHTRGAEAYQASTMQRPIRTQMLTVGCSKLADDYAEHTGFPRRNARGLARATGRQYQDHWYHR